MDYEHVIDLTDVFKGSTIFRFTEHYGVLYVGAEKANDLISLSWERGKPPMVKIVQEQKVSGVK